MNYLAEGIARQTMAYLLYASVVILLVGIAIGATVVWLLA